MPTLDIFKKDVKSAKQKRKEDAMKEAVKQANREWVRKESEAMVVKAIVEREKAKAKIETQRRAREKVYQDARGKTTKRWTEKLKKSPLNVNLVAEEDRIFEETMLRTREETETKRLAETRKEHVKRDLMLKALSEFSDLEALRKEKRAILDEEQRLKALLALEKVTVNQKADRIVAERAMRQRRDAKFQYRRSLYKDSLDQIVEEERFALKKKHGLDRKDKERSEMQIY